MGELSLYHGDKSKVKNFPLKDGQFLIGIMPDKTAAIYIDTKNAQGEVIRVVLDLTNAIERIIALEDKFEVLEESILTNTVISPLITNNDFNIITDDNKSILLR